MATKKKRKLVKRVKVLDRSVSKSPWAIEANSPWYRVGTSWSLIPS
jgi:hypothetical protein